MGVLTSEALGTLRADMRRVETTLGARLRDEIHQELRHLCEEMAQFREEVAERLRQLCEEVRRQPEVADRRPSGPEGRAERG